MACPGGEGGTYRQAFEFDHWDLTAPAALTVDGLVKVDGASIARERLEQRQVVALLQVGVVDQLGSRQHQDLAQAYSNQRHDGLVADADD